MMDRKNMQRELSRKVSHLGIIKVKSSSTEEGITVYTEVQICKLLGIFAAKLHEMALDGKIASFTVFNGVRHINYYLHPDYIVTKRPESNLTEKKDELV